MKRLVSVIVGTSIIASFGALLADDKPAPITAKAKVAMSIEQLLARTDSIAKEVSKLRGLPITKKIPNEVIDRVELRKRLLALASEDKAKVATAAEGLAMMRWGMVPLGTDYSALILGVLDDQIAGYYDPKAKQMTLIGGSVLSDAGWAELVLAHELDHALQDQRFDLQKYQDLPDSEGDAAMARHALVEGDGIALMLEVLLTRAKTPLPWSNPQVSEMIQKEMSTPGNGDALDKAPLVLRESLMFPYRAGFGFVAALRRNQPWSAVDAAFLRPPRSTEQIIHPERYRVDDVPIPVEIAVSPGLTAVLPDATIAHSTVWGELGFDLFLRTHGIHANIAAEAAAGWEGDRAIVVTRGASTAPERAIGITRSEWESEADAVEAAEALIRALDGFVLGGTTEHTATRTSWLALDGTTAWVERRGPSVITVMGAPAWAATALKAEVWIASSVKPAPAPHSK